MAETVFGLQPLDDFHVLVRVESVGGRVQPFLNGAPVCLLDARGRLQGTSRELWPPGQLARTS